MEGLWRRGASLLKGFWALDPILCLCPPLFFFFFFNTCHVSMNQGTFLNPLEVTAAVTAGWWKCPLECNATKDRGTKVCSPRRVRKSSKRLKIVEQLRHRRACGFCLCLLLGYCTWYYGVFLIILSEHSIAFFSFVVFTFIVFIMLKQVVSCCEGMRHGRSPPCCWWL